MTTSQRDVIANARFVANPGCDPTGFIVLVRPVVEAKTWYRGVGRHPSMPCRVTPAADDG